MLYCMFFSSSKITETHVIEVTLNVLIPGKYHISNGTYQIVILAIPDVVLKIGNFQAQLLLHKCSLLLLAVFRQCRHISIDHGFYQKFFGLCICFIIEQLEQHLNTTFIAKCSFIFRWQFIIVFRQCRNLSRENFQNGKAQKLKK